MVHNRKDFVVSKKREDIVIDVGVFSLLDYLPKDMLILIGFFIQDKKDKATYAITCKTINNFFQPDLDKFGLYQSVIDDDRKAVQRILSKKPKLFIVEPKNLIIETPLWPITPLALADLAGLPIAYVEFSHSHHQTMS